MNTAIFLDLDHTIIQPKEEKIFPTKGDPDDWEFIPNAPQAIKWLFDKIKSEHNKHPLIIIVTNQGGVSLGYLSLQQLKNKLACIQAKILNYGLEFTDLLWSISNDNLDFYRKPNPGNAYRAADQWHIMLGHSIMIGDASGKPGNHSNSDLVFAQNAGIGQYLDIVDLINTYKESVKITSS